MTLIYKICPAGLWREAESAGRFAGAPVDLADGYIHFSTADQAPETAARHFAGQERLVLVTVDADALGTALAWEPSRGGELFPHLYGDLPLGAVRGVEVLPLGPDGRHLFPVEIAPEAVALAARALEAAGWRQTTTDFFIGLVGPLWTRHDSEPGRFGLLAERRHLNRNRVVHGGMLMTFADQALGLTSGAVNGCRRQATIQLDTHFMSAVSEGEFVEARCRVARQTRSLMFMAGDLTTGDRMVGSMSGIWKMSE